MFNEVHMVTPEEIAAQCEAIRDKREMPKGVWEPKIGRRDEPMRDPCRGMQKKMEDCELAGSVFHGQRVIHCVSETHARLLIEMGF